mmetsp:Transcript_1869/g.3255  ORF Transcript_1869/g.3255 Transcript_1869/m.3255 type:complete len:116 (+) Transcript_1869:636-983(+)
MGEALQFIKRVSDSKYLLQLSSLQKTDALLTMKRSKVSLHKIEKMEGEKDYLPTIVSDQCKFSLLKSAKLVADEAKLLEMLDRPELESTCRAGLEELERMEGCPLDTLLDYLDEK